MLRVARLSVAGLALATLAVGCSGVSSSEAIEACELMAGVVAARPKSLDDFQQIRSEQHLENFRGSRVVSDSQPHMLYGENRENIVRKVSRSCPDTHAQFWTQFETLSRTARLEQQPPSPPTPSPAPRPAPRPRFDTQEVSRSDFGDRWPLTVDEGVLVCSREGSRVIVTFLVTGSTREYALNASAERQGFPPINPIWADDPRYASSGAGIKIAITTLRSRALELC